MEETDSVIHVAVLREPYLQWILDGEKTVECRLTRQARPPYQVIEPGDRIYFKQSAGPYRGMAAAEEVLCESNLTSRRLREIERDYNDLIRGPREWWQSRADARYITLIWLRDVKATDAGPAIKPLQGAAWRVLEEEPAWRRCAIESGGNRANGSFHIEITEANLRHNTLYATGVLDRFPDWSVGGRTRDDAGRPVTLMLHDGPTIETDIVGPRKLFRWRGWGRWLSRHEANAGDRVVFTPIDDGTYFVGLARIG